MVPPEPVAFSHSDTAMAAAAEAVPKRLCPQACPRSFPSMGRRSGTENVIEIVGLGEACVLSGEDLPKHGEHMKTMRDRLGANAVPIQLPVGAEAEFEGIVDLLAVIMAWGEFDVAEDLNRDGVVDYHSVGSPGSALRTSACQRCCSNSGVGSA